MSGEELDNDDVEEGWGHGTSTTRDGNKVNNEDDNEVLIGFICWNTQQSKLNAEDNDEDNDEDENEDGNEVLYWIHLLEYTTIKIEQWGK